MEKLNAISSAGSSVGLANGVSEGSGAQGIYHGVCEGYKPEYKAEYLKEYPRLLKMRHQRDMMLRFAPAFAPVLAKTFLADLEKFEAYMRTLTEVKWDNTAPNVVCTIGKNTALDAFLAGSAYTAATFMGLIGAVSYTGVPVAGDTMASHATWTEGGATNAPTYTAPRKTLAWSAASSGSKAPSAAPVFAMTGAGTVKGVFISYGAGAVSTIDSTAGVLLSAGLFTGGDQVVVNTNTVTVTYSLAM